MAGLDDMESHASAEPASGREDTELLPEASWRACFVRAFLFNAFAVYVRTALQLHVRGEENLVNAPGVMYLSSHKSDLDGPVCISTLYRLARGRGPLGRMAAVATDGVYEKGFVAGMLLRGRPRLSAMLQSFDVSRVLWALRWYPIPQARRRFLVAHLRTVREMEGNAALRDIFEREPADILPGVAADATIDDALDWSHRKALFSEQELSCFAPRIRDELLERQKRRIADSLARFVAVLDRGDALAMAPEGRLSEHGGLSRIRSGLAQIVSGTRREVTVVPCGVTYDFMTTGRMPVFLSIGRPIPAVKHLSPEELVRQVARAFVSLTTVTMGQLASHFVHARALAGTNSIAETILKADIAGQARRMAGLGLAVADSLLDEAEFEERWRRFIVYCGRHRLLSRDGGTLRFDPDQVLDREVQDTGRTHAWRYSLNEIEALPGWRTEPC